MNYYLFVNEIALQKILNIRLEIIKLMLQLILKSFEF